ncbi:MAG: helix-turn-helix transcriptional regulator [Clostridia bacterium]|nr:helix-turn-helix transcriptional regulator [Clostridia bacterium]
MNNIFDEYYMPLIQMNMFKPCDVPANYPSGGTCFEINPTIGRGHYWIYNSNKNYNIKIHDFRLHEDMVLNMAIPECLSVTYYQSISGEELTPYHRLSRHVVKSFLGGCKPYKALIHKNIPIQSIGIEYGASYYESYLSEQYPGQYQSPQEAFHCIDETVSFPEMVHLLNQLYSYHGQGIALPLYYDAKAAEALSLVFEHHRVINEQKTMHISDADKEMLDIVTAYIGDHYADTLSIEQLCKISCMGSTKLKKTFKAYIGSTISEYIQNTRIGQAEQLLSYTELTIGQIAQAVGYTNAGRFADLFRQSNGVLPLEYRKISQGKHT